MTIRFPAALAAAGVALGVVLTGATSTSAEAWTSDIPTGATTYESFYCVFNYDACVQGQDAAQWAGSVTAWKFPDESHHNTRADAFRHCAWSGAMAQRIGYGPAVEILSNHEAVSYDQPADEYDMDLSNNAVGATLGYQVNFEPVDDKWGWIMDRCESMARNGELTVLR